MISTMQDELNRMKKVNKSTVPVANTVQAAKKKKKAVSMAATHSLSSDEMTFSFDENAEEDDPDGT